MTTPVHLLVSSGGPKLSACGVNGNEFGSWRASIHKLAVSCPACIMTPEFTHAVQRIPLIEGGPYRHG